MSPALAAEKFLLLWKADDPVSTLPGFTKHRYRTIKDYRKPQTDDPWPNAEEVTRELLKNLGPAAAAEIKKVTCVLAYATGPKSRVLEFVGFVDESRRDKYESVMEDKKNLEVFSKEYHIGGGFVLFKPTTFAEADASCDATTTNDGDSTPTEQVCTVSNADNTTKPATTAGLSVLDGTSAVLAVETELGVTALAVTDGGDVKAIEVTGSCGADASEDGEDEEVIDPKSKALIARILSTLPTTPPSKNDHIFVICTPIPGLPMPEYKVPRPYQPNSYWRNLKPDNSYLWKFRKDEEETLRMRAQERQKRLDELQAKVKKEKDGIHELELRKKLKEQMPKRKRVAETDCSTASSAVEAPIASPTVSPGTVTPPAKKARLL